MASKGWKLFSTVSAVASGIVVKKLLDLSWKTATGRPPPKNPENPDVDWREAVAFGMASGAALTVGRLMATRRAAAYYRRSTGHLPDKLAEPSK
ncbi:MAG: DUF4235 domain-containing protein [Propionibacteriales bacterium]|nr:DUF4235 domain-containing protein [Propionibacteriales bacterium]